MPLRRQIAVFVVGLCCAWPALSLSQDGQQPQQGATLATPKAKAPAAARKVTRRLPNNYGKLQLNDAQKETIYGLQTMYNSKIEALEEQIQMLKEQRDAEIEAVLTPAQKQALKALLTQSKTKKPAANAPQDAGN
jgi:hypothetical protein